MKGEATKNFDPLLLLDSMTESVLVTSADLEAPGPTILYVNHSFEKMTGWNREEVIGKSPRILQGPDTEHAIFNDLREKLEAGEHWSGRTINYRKDTSQFHMEWSIAPIFGADGQISQYVAVQRDVTELVKLEVELERARKVEIERLSQIETKNKQLSELIADQRRTVDLFTKYVPEAVVKKALERPDINHISAKLNVALLFCDIRDFTGLIEGMKPAEVVELLNVYYSRMSEAISEYQGVINQFVGDEIFVAFGAPKPIELPALSAVRCALSMMAQLSEINRDLKNLLKDGTELKVGIGINFGSVVAGNLGSDDRLSYAVTGRAVVTAKRIEALTRSSPNSILVSQPVYDMTVKEIDYRVWGSVLLKGLNKKIKVYEVVSAEDRNEINP